jgi:undecaprenyl-phosphate galactose phosphotransferase
MTKRIVKEAMDRVLALLGLLALFPIFLILFFWIRKDGGSAFYGHKRIGLNGKEFKCWKFRTMVVNAQEKLEELLDSDPAIKAEWEANFKLAEDPRITKIGNILRKTSLDELPQLWNVLKGDMSLVGPHPVVAEEQKLYGAHWDNYLSTKPGITGLWQVNGRSDTTYQERVEMDTHYVQNWSLVQDFVILLRTVMVVVSRTGAY